MTLLGAWSERLADLADTALTLRDANRHVEAANTADMVADLATSIAEHAQMLTEAWAAEAAAQRSMAARLERTLTAPPADTPEM